MKSFRYSKLSSQQEPYGWHGGKDTKLQAPSQIELVVLSSSIS